MVQNCPLHLSTLPVLLDEHMVNRALHYLTFPLYPWKPHFSPVVFQYFPDPLATPRSLAVSMNQDLDCDGVSSSTTLGRLLPPARPTRRRSHTKRIPN